MFQSIANTEKRTISAEEFNYFSGLKIDLEQTKNSLKNQRDNMERWELLGGLLQRFGSFNFNRWEHRLITQKLIYLIQNVLGEKLGYNFHWYLRGPYTSLLADDFSKLNSFYSLFFNQSKFNKESNLDVLYLR